MADLENLAKILSIFKRNWVKNFKFFQKKVYINKNFDLCIFIQIFLTGSMTFSTTVLFSFLILFGLQHASCQLQEVDFTGVLPAPADEVRVEGLPRGGGNFKNKNAHFFKLLCFKNNLLKILKNQRNFSKILKKN